MAASEALSQDQLAVLAYLISNSTWRPWKTRAFCWISAALVSITAYNDSAQQDDDISSLTNASQLKSMLAGPFISRFLYTAIFGELLQFSKQITLYIGYLKDFHSSSVMDIIKIALLMLCNVYLFAFMTVIEFEFICEPFWTHAWKATLWGGIMTDALLFPAVAVVWNAPYMIGNLNAVGAVYEYYGSKAGKCWSYCNLAAFFWCCFGIPFVVLGPFYGYSSDPEDEDSSAVESCDYIWLLPLMLFLAILFSQLFFEGGTLTWWHKCLHKCCGNTHRYGKILGVDVLISHTAYTAFYEATILYVFVATIVLLFLYEWRISDDYDIWKIINQVLKVVIFVIVQLWTWLRTKRSLKNDQLISLLYVASSDMVVHVDYFEREIQAHGVWIFYNRLEVNVTHLGNRGEDALQSLKKLLVNKYGNSDTNVQEAGNGVQLTIQAHE